MNHSWKSPGRREALLGCLLMLSAGCQGDVLEEEDSAPLAAMLEQELTQPQPQSCEDIKLAQPAAGDGEYMLFLLGDPGMPWKAYCHDMAGTPREYLPLRETGQTSNYSQYTAGGASPGTSVRTVYFKLRIHPFTQEVDTSDRTFATSTGQLLHVGAVNSPITAMPYGTAMSCDYGDSGRANIDLRGTPFKVAPGFFEVAGWGQHGAQAYSFVDQVVSLTGGGYCGWNAPLQADSFAGGRLRLLYTLANPAWMPAVRLSPPEGTPIQAQSFQPGFYDFDELRVGTNGIGAIHVPRGWSVTLYKFEGFKGDNVTFQADSDITGNGHDRWARSMKVEAPVLAYRGAAYQFSPQVLRAGRYDMAQLAVGNDNLRSIKVPDGFQVTLFQHGGFAGERLLLTQDTDLTGHSFDAQTSSILVESPTARYTNVIHGEWQYSGGQDPAHARNRQLIVDYTGQPDIVTFELDSVAGPYLYLQDADGRTLAQARNVGGNSFARISRYLLPGTYRLVAATTDAGRTAPFTLRSDKARLRPPLNLWVKPVNGFDWIYDDRGTGANDDVSVWRPRSEPQAGYYSLGDVAMPERGRQPRVTFLVHGDAGLLAPPVDYQAVWDDGGTGGTFDVAFWRPVAPPGYTCLGSVARLNYEKPSTDLIRCVRSDYVLSAGAGWVWSDKGSGGRHDITVWEADPADHRILTTSTMVAQAGYGGADGALFWGLNKSLLANPELQGAGFVDDLAALRFAPRLWLHPDEGFYPSSLEFYVQNMVEVGGRLTTRENLGCPSCTDPSFLRGQHTNPVSAPVFAQIIPRAPGGVPTNVTDIVYWFFFPYQQGKERCSNIMPNGLCSNYRRAVNRVGDWEHLTLRFVDGRPSEVVMTQSNNGGHHHFGHKDLGLVSDFRPEVLVAHGAHGLYADSGAYTYKYFTDGMNFVDFTAMGREWNSTRNLTSFVWQPPGTYAIPALRHFNITLDWGNARDGCGDGATRGVGDCVLSAGQQAPSMRSFAQPGSMDMK